VTGEERVGSFQRGFPVTIGPALPFGNMALLVIQEDQSSGILVLLFDAAGFASITYVGLNI